MEFYVMNNTLHNGFKLLDYLAMAAKPVSVKELAEHFSLPNSHVCRLLKTLTETGYVEQYPHSRKYGISLKILHLAHARIQNERLLGLARPYLRQLCEKLDAVVFVTRSYCGMSLIIGTEYPILSQQERETLTGALHDPTSSACGRICAAYAGSDLQKDLMQKIDWNAPGDFQNRPESFLEELSLIRRRGYTWRAPADSAGGVGVPLFDSDCICNGALGVMLPSSRMNNADLLQNVIEAALNCGKLISFAQGAPAEGYPYINNQQQRGKNDFC